MISRVFFNVKGSFFDFYTLQQFYPLAKSGSTEILCPSVLFSSTRITEIFLPVYMLTSSWPRIVHPKSRLKTNFLKILMKFHFSCLFLDFNGSPRSSMRSTRQGQIGTWSHKIAFQLSSFKRRRTLIFWKYSRCLEMRLHNKLVLKNIFLQTQIHNWQLCRW